MTTPDTVPATIDAYIAAFAPEIQSILQQIRATVRAAAPDAREKISYRMPAFTQHGILLYFAAFKHHIGHLIERIVKLRVAQDVAKAAKGKQGKARRKGDE